MKSEIQTAFSLLGPLLLQKRLQDLLRELSHRSDLRAHGQEAWIRARNSGVPIVLGVEVELFRTPLTRHFISQVKMVKLGK